MRGASEPQTPAKADRNGAAFSGEGQVLANVAVSSGLVRLDVQVAGGTGFEPGQFAMLNLCDRDAFVFSRPFSILASGAGTVSFLYRVVGCGTAAMAALEAGDRLSVLGPLGRPFPPPADGQPVVLMAGGVGLPPLAAWRDRYGRAEDQAFFGARDGGDVPWNMLGDGWLVSVEDPEGVSAGRSAFRGLVTSLALTRLADKGPGPLRVLACGPEPLLRAAAALAAERSWDCWLSLEEHMGCGYGVCKGCVVRVASDEAPGWRNATCCQEGPVFRASELVWR